MNKISKSSPKTEPKPFPKLMKNKIDGRLVWFADFTGRGVELHDPCSPILEVSTEWEIDSFQDTDIELIVNAKD